MNLFSLLDNSLIKEDVEANWFVGNDPHRVVTDIGDQGCHSDL